MRSIERNRVSHSHIFEEQWQVDWLIATALLYGLKESSNDFQRTFLNERGNWQLYIFLRDPLPNATVHYEWLTKLIEDDVKRRHFIEGREREFFAIEA